jgi:hypothetical protein
MTAAPQTVQVQFVLHNNSSDHFVLCIEPWARDIQLGPRSSASIECHAVDPKVPIYIGLEEVNYISLNDVGDSVRVRCDGKEYLIGDVERNAR